MLTHNYEKNRSGELTEIILDALVLGTIVTMVVLAPNAIQLFRNYGKKVRPKRKDLSVFYNQIRQMKKQRLVGETKKDGQTCLVITEKGRERWLSYKEEDMKIPILKHWDGKWWAVSYDIPKEFKLASETFRQKMKDLGLYFWQKSLWIYPFDPGDEIEYLTELYDIAPFVSVFRIDHLPKSDDLFLQAKFAETLGSL